MLIEKKRPVGVNQWVVDSGLLFYTGELGINSVLMPRDPLNTTELKGFAHLVPMNKKEYKKILKIILHAYESQSLILHGVEEEGFFNFCKELKDKSMEDVK